MPPHAEVNGKSQLQYESNQHPLASKKKKKEKSPSSIIIPFPLGVIHKIKFSRI